MNLFDSKAPQSETQPNWSDTTDRSSALMQKMSEKLEALLQERNQLRQELSKQRITAQARLSASQELSGSNRQLQEECLNLQTELSETQRLNQSLHRENDNLRNSAGLMLRDEQEKPAAEKRIKQSNKECRFWKLATFIVAGVWILTVLLQTVGIAL